MIFLPIQILATRFILKTNFVEMPLTKCTTFRKSFNKIRVQLNMIVIRNTYR